MKFQDRAVWMPLRQRAAAVGLAEVEEAAELPAAPRWAAVVVAGAAAALRVQPWVAAWAARTRQAAVAAAERPPKSLSDGRALHRSARLRSRKSTLMRNSLPIGRAT